ncbi:MAG TPA: hypothetical protein VKU00_29750, partial [Chthonomonadaceae bacterium]|nr:hypothetical protein [Chthonomonadaceae bacterium]
MKQSMGEGKSLMNRREFLHSMSGSILVTAMSVAQARAQSHNASASEDIVFADFESGNYDDWTLTGDCWTNTPASAFRFPKVTGYQGKRFLCTFHPTLGNAATGKAVSKEFTMDKPFINFLIGGGNYPHKACLNLVLGAEVVRTATGSNSTELRQAWWDVTPFLGKKAHLEVVDDTTSQDRGYIMVDDIRFSQFKRGKQALENEPEPAVTPERPPLREAVLRFCRQRVGVQVGDGECGTLVIQALASAGARPRQADFPESGDYVWGV